MNEDAVHVPYHYGSDFKGLLPSVKGFVHARDSIINYRDLLSGSTRSPAKPSGGMRPRMPARRASGRAGLGRKPPSASA